MRRFGLGGQFVSVACTLPADFGEYYRGEFYAYAVKERIPTYLKRFPPSPFHDLKEYSTAFCVDTLGIYPDYEREAIILELRRIAAQVVIVGGSTAQELVKLDFQRVGLCEFEGVVMGWGIWFSRWAERRRSRLDLKPESALGYFGAAGKHAEMRVWACEKCGTLDYTGAQKFKCQNAECGHANTAERKRHKHYRNEEVKQ
jgi:hypothetical protein